MMPSFTKLTNSAALLIIWYSCELTLYLRILTDFSGLTLHCESEPGEACSEENF